LPQTHNQNLLWKILCPTLNHTYPKWFAINWCTTFSCTSRITTLGNKTLDYSMKYQIVVISFQAQLDKVATCLWCFFWPKLNVNISNSCSKKYLKRKSIEYWLAGFPSQL
jgi:hypothetical protein